MSGDDRAELLATVDNFTARALDLYAPFYAAVAVLDLFVDGSILRVILAATVAFLINCYVIELDQSEEREAR